MSVRVFLLCAGVISTGTAVMIGANYLWCAVAVWLIDWVFAQGAFPFR